VRHVIAQERAPALTGRVISPLGHVLGHRRLRHRKPKLEQLTMNVRRTPEFSTLMRRINARNSAEIGGRPPRFLDFQRQ
jgi:hypothetical protein